MPLIMKSENGSSTQHQQLCLNPNQVVVSESNFNGQMSAPQPQQAQLINLANGELNGSSPSQQSNYTYQLLTSNDHQQPQQQNGHASTSSHRTPKQTKSFKCDQCNMTFTTKSAHTSHIKSHAKQQNASLISDNTSNINGTQQMQSSDPYQCDVCKKTFAVPARLVSFSFLFLLRSNSTVFDESEISTHEILARKKNMFLVQRRTFEALGSLPFKHRALW